MIAITVLSIQTILASYCIIACMHYEDRMYNNIDPLYVYYFGISNLSTQNVELFFIKLRFHKTKNLRNSQKLSIN